MKLKCNKCGKIYTKFKNSHYKNHVENCKGLDFKSCDCGCGKKVINHNNKYIVGHNFRGMKTSIKTRKKQSEGLKKHHKENKEFWKKVNKNISKTKNSPEGKKRLMSALEKCKHKIGPRGQAPPNKISDKDKIKKKCLECGKIMLLVPVEKIRNTVLKCV